MKNKDITHQVVYNTKDKYITFKLSDKSYSFVLIQEENRLTFGIPVFNPEYKLFKLDKQINEWYISIIEYIINSNVAEYISFKIKFEITHCYFQLHPHHLLPIM